MPETKEVIEMTFLTHNGTRLHVAVETEPTAQNFLEAFRAFLYVCGFHAKTIAELLNDDELT